MCLLACPSATGKLTVCELSSLISQLPIPVAKDFNMAYFFYNTDANSLASQGRYPVLIQHGIAATSGPYNFGERLGQLAPGDILLMYENLVGVVAVGTVTGHWDRATHQSSIYYQPGDDGFAQEYRIEVTWCDWSRCPVSIDVLRERIGYTPRGTITRIITRQAEVEQLIEEWQTAVDSQQRHAEHGVVADDEGA